MSSGAMTLDALLASLATSNQPTVITLGDGQQLVTLVATPNGSFGIAFFSHEQAYSKLDLGRTLTKAEEETVDTPDYVLDIKDKKALLVLKSVIESALVMYDESTSPSTAVRLAAIMKYKEVHDNIYIS